MTKRTRKYVSFILAVAMIFVFSLHHVFASEHVHTPDFNYSGAKHVEGYLPSGNTLHQKFDFVFTICSTCGEQVSLAIPMEFSDHVFDSNDHYSGQHYHEGNYHYYYVGYKTCSTCGYVDSFYHYTWLRVICPGNDNGNGCITPYRLFPELELY